MGWVAELVWAGCGGVVCVGCDVVAGCDVAGDEVLVVPELEDGCAVTVVVPLLGVGVVDAVGAVEVGVVFAGCVGCNIAGVVLTPLPLEAGCVAVCKPVVGTAEPADVELLPPPQAARVLTAGRVRIDFWMNRRREDCMRLLHKGHCVRLRTTCGQAILCPDRLY